MTSINSSSGRPHYWVLEGHMPVPAVDIMEWALFFEDDVPRRVGLAEISVPGCDSVRVSTVFIGTDMRYFGEGPPILFETMVFGGPFNGDCYRYATWDEAEAGHQMLIDEATLESNLLVHMVREKLQAFARGGLHGRGEDAKADPGERRHD